ncbi:hypothetical protein [Nocardioides sp.]|uniref:hypothetical protein n=1 Tax=Nocardioides sp. TaxID=35761 RepID=UPI0037831741
MSGDREDPDVGSVAEEAVKLLGALTDWAKDTAQDVDQHLATGATECTYCPICRTVHTVRQLSPEVRAQLTTAATALLQAASGLLATAAQEQPPRPGVQRIDLDDAGGAQDDDWAADGWPEETDPEEGDE